MAQPEGRGVDRSDESHQEHHKPPTRDTNPQADQPSRGPENVTRTLATPIELPGDEVVEKDELFELEAPADPEEEALFEEALEEIASAERDAASDVDLVHLK
jgi:hypothetical protein